MGVRLRSGCGLRSAMNDTTVFANSTLRGAQAKSQLPELSGIDALACSPSELGARLELLTELATRAAIPSDLHKAIDAIHLSGGHMTT